LRAEKRLSRRSASVSPATLAIFLKQKVRLVGGIREIDPPLRSYTPVFALRTRRALPLSSYDRWILQEKEKPMIANPLTTNVNWAGIPEISRETIVNVVGDMNEVGFGVLPGYLKVADLEDLRQFVETAVAAAGGEYVGFTGAEAVAGTLLEKLSTSPAFRNLLHQVYELGARRPAPNQSLYQVLRCLKGKSGLKHALYFHYDSYVVTALLPVIIPAQGSPGHLVMAPNRRPVRSSYFFNLLDKIILDNQATQFLLRHASGLGLLKLKQIRMVPGNLYLFWGYRSVHANEACDPDKIRATALFHFGDPHADSRLRKFTGRAKRRAKSRS